MVQRGNGVGIEGLVLGLHLPLAAFRSLGPALL